MASSKFVLRIQHVVRDVTSVLVRTQLVRKLLPGVRQSSGFAYVPDVAPPDTGKNGATRVIV